ncbi:MAG: SDR family oxidoreductase [Chloroflexota bacterium]
MMDKLAIVTGANRGIGKEVCRQLAQLGYTVLLTSRDVTQGETAVADLKRSGGDIHFHQLDVIDEASVAQLRAYVVAHWGAPAVLVNNAAILIDNNERVLDVSPDIFAATFAPNVWGMLRLCQAFAPLMREKGYGRIVNVSSEMGQLRWLNGGTPAYSLSKTALNGLTLMLARSLKGTGVLVNAVCPGWVRTDMGGPNASKSVAEGADTIVWAATFADDGPTGAFFQERQQMDW